MNKKVVEQAFMKFILQWTTHQQLQDILDSPDAQRRGQELSDKINNLAKTVIHKTSSSKRG